MDSIIAHQKIGRRKSASGILHRQAGRRGYPVLDLEGVLEAPRARGKNGKKETQRPRRRAFRLPWFGSRIPKRDEARRTAPAAAFVQRLRPRFGKPSLSVLGARLRRLGSGFPKLSGLRLTLSAAALLAILAALALGLGALISGPSFPMPDGELLPVPEASPSILLDYVSPELADGAADSDQGAAALPPVPVALEMSSYTVRASDSLASIAKRFGLNIDTIISVNGISSARSLRSGSQLRIPNINGLVYNIRPGDSLASVAKRYKMDATRIADANDLGSASLIIGRTLFIPGARLPQSVVSQAMGQTVAWPARGPLSSYFGYRPDPFTGVRRFHAGIDIVMDQGTPVRAAMGGRVSDTGYNANYGNYVIMNHADGFQTLYGHLSSILVREGASIEQGAQIGLSGNTGYSTGPHLHFGIFRRSLALNPLKFLK